MSCPHCNTFVGNPCPSCRTLSRVKFFLGSGRLQQKDEHTVLTALRSVAGVLSDLVETSPLTVLPVGPTPWADYTPAPEVGGVSSGLEGSGHKAEEAEGPTTKVPKDKKDKKEKKKEKHRRKEVVKEESESEVVPASGSRDRPLEATSTEAEAVNQEETAESIRAEKALPLVAEEEPAREEREEVAESHPEVEGEAEETTVAENSYRYSGGRRPARGSAADHFRARDAVSGSFRPPEPEGPPPLRRRHGEGRSTPRVRTRSRSRRRGTKGASHRARGRWWRPRNW